MGGHGFSSFFSRCHFPCWRSGIFEASALTRLGGTGGRRAAWAPLFLFFFANLLWLWGMGDATAAVSGRAFEESGGCDPGALFLLVSQEVSSQSGGRGGERGGVGGLLLFNRLSISE